MQFTSGMEGCCLKLLKEQSWPPENGRIFANVQLILLKSAKVQRMEVPSGSAVAQSRAHSARARESRPLAWLCDQSPGQRNVLPFARTGFRVRDEPRDIDRLMT